MTGKHRTVETDARWTRNGGNAEQVRMSLDRLCESAEFARSEQMNRFLRFLVERELAGDTLPLKEPLIGIQVFNRAADWNPAEDTIVRTEARRLRIKLDRYYEKAGREDKVLIRVPKGAYRAEITVRDFASEGDLSRDLSVSPSVGNAPNKPRFTRIAWLVTVLFLITALFTITIRLISSRRAERNAAFEVTALATAIGQEFSPAISPDGERVAYVWDGDETNYRIYIKNIETGTTALFTNGPAPELYPAWSPNGDRLAYLRKGNEMTDVIIRQTSGGSEHVITRIATESGRWAGDNSPLLGAPGPSWEHDGNRLIVADVEKRPQGAGLYSIAINTGDRNQLTFPPGEMRDFYPKVSPDGRKLAFVRFLSHGVAQLFVGTIQPESGRLVGEPEQITYERQTIRGVDWTDKDSLVFASNRSGIFQLFDINVANRKLQLLPTDTSSVAEPSVDPVSGRIVFVKTNENWNIWRFSIQKGILDAPTRLLASSGENHSPAYSTDGKKIAFISDRSGKPELWVSDGDGSSPKQLTHIDGSWVASPVWSPDSRIIAFDARPNGSAAIFTIPSAGGSSQALEQDTFENRAPAWSADGQTIYYNSNRTGLVALWGKALQGGSAEQVGPKNSYLAQRDTSGSWFYSDLKGKIFEASPDWQTRAGLPDAVQAFPVTSWTVRDGIVYFTSRTNSGQAQINSYTKGKGVQTLGVTSAPVVMNTKTLSLSPDHRYLLVSLQDSVGSDILMRVTSKKTR